MDTLHIITPAPNNAWPSEHVRPAPTPAGSLWRWLERILLIAGLVLLGYYGYVSIETRLYQAVENRELDAILASAPRASAPRRLPPPLPGSTVGRIEIPRLGVSTVIRAGVDARTLKLAVGHIPGTALPGESGNIGLAGHRDTFFRRLRDIDETDQIRLVTAAGTFTFQVTETFIVQPTDTWVLHPTDASTLTLITCYPFTYIGSAPQRFIVRASQAR